MVNDVRWVNDESCLLLGAFVCSSVHCSRVSRFVLTNSKPRSSCQSVFMCLISCGVFASLTFGSWKIFSCCKHWPLWWKIRKQAFFQKNTWKISKPPYLPSRICHCVIAILRISHSLKIWQVFTCPYRYITTKKIPLTERRLKYYATSPRKKKKMN